MWRHDEHHANITRHHQTLRDEEPTLGAARRLRRDVPGRAPPVDLATRNRRSGTGSPRRRRQPRQHPPSQAGQGSCPVPGVGGRRSDRRRGARRPAPGVVEEEVLAALCPSRCNIDEVAAGDELRGVPAGIALADIPEDVRSPRARVHCHRRRRYSHRARRAVGNRAPRRAGGLGGLRPPHWRSPCCAESSIEPWEPPTPRGANRRHAPCQRSSPVACGRSSSPRS